MSGVHGVPEASEQRLARVQREAPSQFIAYCVSRGLCVDSVMADGTLHRCDVDGKQRGNKAGAYLLHLNAWPAGGCQNFTDGEGWQNWHATDNKYAGGTPARSEEMRQQVKAAQAERERLRKIEQANAARTAGKLYGGAHDADPAHPYLKHKGITAPAGVRQSGGLLLVPMYEVGIGKLCGLQTIDAYGVKRFSAGMGITGCFVTFDVDVGGAEAASAPRTIAICEGFATGASIHAATDWYVVCSFTAHNLPNVASTIRKYHPTARIVICADNDHGTERAGKGNAGMKAGRAAAKAVGGLMVAPPNGGGTDWNDYSQMYGVEALRTVLTKALSTTATLARETTT